MVHGKRDGSVLGAGNGKGWGFRLSWFPGTICLSIVGNKGEAPKNQVRGSGEQARKPGFRPREWTELGMGKMAG